MTRKDYIKIAAELTETRDWARGRANAKPTIDHITAALADIMAADNPDFDRKRFYAAAGMSVSAGPSRCPNCSGEREWDRPGVALCHFCGQEGAS